MLVNGEAVSNKHNDIDIVSSKRRKYNDIDIVSRVIGNKEEKASRVDRIADHLVRKFGAPGSRNFFCKCAWKMGEDEIWCTYEQAHGPKVKSPLKYFISVCTIKMAR